MYMNKTYNIIVIGCQMNKSDSERISAYLADLGYIKKDDKYDSDLVVITTCGVRQSAEDRVYGIVPSIKEKNPKSSIILTGCLSKRIDVQKRLKHLVDIWLPIEDLPKLNDKLLKIKDEEIGSISPSKYLEISPQYSSKFSAFVPIGNGCDNFCTYCVVPYARGREVYRPAQEIINEVKKLVKMGYKEITLIAQNVDSYNSNYESKILDTCGDFALQRLNKINFAQLLKIINDIPGKAPKFWIRFSTSHPKDMSDELIQVISDCDKVCEYVHLPVQAGDNEILDRMNRKYTVEHYFNLINKIRKINKTKTSNNKQNKAWCPPISITTDIIVGFPGETEEQFQNTLDLCKKVKFNMAYIGQYSPRPNTPAYKLEDNVSKEEKKRREYELMKVIRKTSLEDNKKYLGKIVEVLVEGRNRKGEWLGKTRTFKVVKVKSQKSKVEDFIGEFVKVKITDVEDFGMKGKLNM